MTRVERIIKDLEDSLNSGFINFDILDELGNIDEEEIEILNTKIDASVWLTAKGWRYDFQKIESRLLARQKFIDYIELCRIEIFQPHKESEFIYIYATLADTEEDTTKVTGWEVSQSCFSGTK